MAHRTEVLILQHPLEVDHAKNTARLLHLSLARSHLLVGECWSEAAVAAAGLAPRPSVSTLLLYPRSTPALAHGLTTEAAGEGEVAGAWADGDSHGRAEVCAFGCAESPADEGAIRHAAAAAVADAGACACACPVAGGEVAAGLRLVVLDATWRKSRKMLHLSPWLQSLPRCSLDGAPASRYAIRKAHQPGQLSTLEAVCEALAQLEGDAARFQSLLSAFDGFVAQQLALVPATGRRLA